MTQIEMFVKLIIPDTTAITAKHTLEKMGYKFEDLKRMDYYKFDTKDADENLNQELGKVDILVNANKHRFTNQMPEQGVKILVKDIDNPGAGILSTLKNRLGFDNIEKVEKGTLWIITGADKTTVEEMAKNLFVNENYQQFEVY